MKIVIDFPFVLTAVVFTTGVISLIDMIFFSRQRRVAGKAQPLVVEYARSFFPILFLVLLIRSFMVQPFRVPTGSLEPTILPGDFILVNQFVYGLRLPVLHKKIVAIEEPRTGDIALFRSPIDPAIVYVKRVIGLPGDHLVYRNKKLTINGKGAEQEDLGLDLDGESSVMQPVRVMLEKLPNVAHKIFIRPLANLNGSFDLVVPEGHYFMLGDNRDNSGDSRVWGFVPESSFIGKAFMIWMSWDNINKTIRWHRIGKAVN